MRKSPSYSKALFLIELGTSGDTGSAAISAVRGLAMIDIIVLLPGGRCTKIQQLQMTTVHDANIHNFVGKYVIDSRFFVLVGHETTYAAIGNHHFSTKTCHCQTHQNY